MICQTIFARQSFTNVITNHRCSDTSFNNV
jgi:hypothetical protein